MKRLFSAIFGLTLIASLATSAFALEPMPLELEQPDAGYSVLENNQTPFMSDKTKWVGAATLSGLNDGHFYRYRLGTAGYDFPKRVGQVSTRLSTTGYGTEVRTGFATVNWGAGETIPVAYSDQKLTSLSYKIFNNYNTSETYYPFITNDTGGVVRGTVQWYSIIE